MILYLLFLCSTAKSILQRASEHLGNRYSVVKLQYEELFRTSHAYFEKLAHPANRILPNGPHPKQPKPPGSSVLKSIFLCLCPRRGQYQDYGKRSTDIPQSFQNIPMFFLHFYLQDIIRLEAFLNRARGSSAGVSSLGFSPAKEL